MKIQVKTLAEVVTEIEIEFPYFTEDSAHKYMFVETGCVQLTESKYLGTRIEFHFKDSMPDDWMTLPNITKDDFVAAYVLAKNKFDELIN